MLFNYLIVLFKNKEKKRIINKFKTYNRAIKYYENKLKESDSIIFYKNYENGIKCDYELALIGVGENNNEIYVKDDLGRRSKVELSEDGLYIKKIKPFRVKEKILDYKHKDKITVNELIKRYLRGGGFKMISKLNNKIIIQNDDVINLFTLKNIYDADKFIDTLSDYFRSINRSDCMFVKDVSTSQRKELYDLLVKRGFPKRYLTRLSTTHLK